MIKYLIECRVGGPLNLKLKLIYAISTESRIPLVNVLGSLATLGLQ